MDGSSMAVEQLEGHGSTCSLVEAPAGMPNRLRRPRGGGPEHWGESVAYARRSPVAALSGARGLWFPLASSRLRLSCARASGTNSRGLSPRVARRRHRLKLLVELGGHYPDARPAQAHRSSAGRSSIPRRILAYPLRPSAPLPRAKEVTSVGGRCAGCHAVHDGPPVALASGYGQKDSATFPENDH